MAAAAVARAASLQQQQQQRGQQLGGRGMVGTPAAGDGGSATGAESDLGSESPFAAALASGLRRAAEREIGRSGAWVAAQAASANAAAEVVEAKRLRGIVGAAAAREERQGNQPGQG